MALLFSSFCNTYETVKYVRIPDARLASLRVIFLLLIVVYVVVIEMLGKGGYLEANRVVGTVRFSLRQPTLSGCDPSTATPSTNQTCLNDFTPLNQLPYCQQAHQRKEHDVAKSDDSKPNGRVYPCQIYESVNAQIVRETSIVVWTKAVVQNETLVCSGAVEPLQKDETQTCPRTYEATAQSSPFYVAEPEKFTLLLDHAVTAGRICEQRSQQVMSHSYERSTSSSFYACSTQSSDSARPGRLYSVQQDQCRYHFLHNNSYMDAIGEKLVQSVPCFIGANQTDGSQDFFPLETLLQAAGLELDACNTRRQFGRRDPGSFSAEEGNGLYTNCRQSFRESGATLLINIIWSDFRPYHLGAMDEPFYYYKVTWIGNVYKEQIPYYTQSYRNHRTLVSAHGIQINALITGDFHHFEWLNFWLTLTAAVGLLAVATTVVDSCMLYFLPESPQYQGIKYEAPLETAEAARSGVEDPTVDSNDSDLLTFIEEPLLSEDRGDRM